MEELLSWKAPPAPPVMRDFGHDVWLCTFTIEQQLEMPSVRCWAALARVDCTFCKFHHSKDLTSRVILPQLRQDAV
jgi:hypothetical protein